MEALCPVSAQASSSSSLFVFRFTKMAEFENVAGENSKNGFTSTEKSLNNHTDNEGEQSPTQHNDDFSGNTDDGGLSTGCCSDAGGRTTDTSQERQSKPSKKGLHSTHTKSKGLKRTLTRKKTTKRKAGTPKYSGKRKKQRRESSSSESSLSSSSSCSDSSSSSDEENEAWKMTKSEDKNSWKLPKKLAKSFSHSMKEHYTDIDLRDNILEGSPPPKNIPPTPCLDSAMETYLGEAKAPFTAVNDKALARISSKIRDVTGPLGHLWKMCHKGRVSKRKSKFMKEKLDQSMVLIAQAVSAITFHRRRAILTSISRNKERAHRWLKEKYTKQLREPTADLFGADFHKAVQKDARSVDLSTIRYLRMQAKQKTTPFRGGSTARARHSSSAVEHTKAASTSARGSRGKYITKNEEYSHFQHRSEASKTNECPPIDTGAVEPIQAIPPNGGETETFSPTMGKAHKGLTTPKLDKGLQNSSVGNALPIKSSMQTSHKQRTKCNFIKRGVQHVGNGRDSESKPHKGRNYKQSIYISHEPSEEGPRRSALFKIQQIQQNRSEAR